MRSFGPTPLWRSTVGFDHLFNLIENTLRSSDDNYPPFDIERVGEDQSALTRPYFRRFEASRRVMCAESGASDKLPLVPSEETVYPTN